MIKLSKMSLSHLFVLLSLCSTFLFTTAGFIFGRSANLSSPTMRQAMSQLSQQTIMQAFEQEIPYLRFNQQKMADVPKPFSLFLFETVTSLQPTDLRSLLGGELPGLSTFNVEVLAKGQNVNIQDLVIESPPPTDPLSSKDITKVQPNDNNKTATDAPPPAGANDKPKAETGAGERDILIYNTHNTESWSYVANNDSVTDDTKNVTLISKMLSDELTKRGIKAIFDNTDHQKMLNQQGLPYAFSYAESLKTVKADLKKDRNIDYIFDIHRDTKPKKATTAVVNGKSYARTLFVIGKGNPHWEQNAEFAKKIHYLLEKKYPGLSEGVFAKSKEEGNGEYNQSVSPNAVLIEIGGVDNTQDELNNTAAALADVIGDIYFEDAKKVDSPADSGKKKS
jgi:stage II sporulation protein P